MMHFLGHRRTASQQSIDPETQQQPQQQWRPHHQHRLSASSALWQAAQALGSIGAPAAAAAAATSPPGSGGPPSSSTFESGLSGGNASSASAAAAASASHATANANVNLNDPPTAGTTAGTGSSSSGTTAGHTRPPLPNPVPSYSSSVYSQQSQQSQYSPYSLQQLQHQQQQQRQSGYFQPNHHSHPSGGPPHAGLGIGLASPSTTSSLQYTPEALKSSSTSTPPASTSASTTTTAVAAGAPGPLVPKDPPAVPNFHWDNDYYQNTPNNRNKTISDTTTNSAAATRTPTTATDSASARALQPHQSSHSRSQSHSHSYFHFQSQSQSHSHSHSYSHSYSQSNPYSPSSSSHPPSSSSNIPPFSHSRSQSHSQHNQQRASIPAALLPAHGQQLHRDSPNSLPTHSTATQTSGPPGLSPSVTLLPAPTPSSSSSPSSSSALAAMNQQQQQQQQQQQSPQQSQPQFQTGTPRRTGTYSSQSDELHMPAGMIQHGQPSPREYSSSSAAPAAPHIKLEQSSPNSHPQAPPYQSTSSVPNVLQPGGAGGRPPAISANTAPSMSAMQPQQQQQDYQTPSKPPSLSLSHSYSRSSPAAGYEGGSSFAPYTPTTPSGSGSQFMSPPDQKYNAPGSQRNISNTPLGLADIRPRADSSMSDGVPGSAAYELANAQPGTSNYLAPWALYAFDWCKWPPQGNGAGKLAVGSYLEDGHNYIQILDTQMVPTPNDVYQPGTPKINLEFQKVAEATHSYPVTRLLWEPPSSQKQSTDLLATSGDHLRLWSLPSESPVSQNNSITNRARDPAVTKLTPLALLSNSKTPDHTAPLTSLDWNTVSPSLIITSSIDTTCTIWDIPSLTAKTQLIAHDKEVYDVRFCANSVDVFVSCGQDGSVRMFDLRSLEHSTIIYEPTGKDERDANGGRISPTLAQQTMSNPPPLLRLATSPHDTHLLATFAQDSNVIRILDVRHPGQALLELRGHGGSLNSIEWSPTRRGVLASGADDCQVLLWDVYNNNPALGGGPPANGAAQPDNTRSPYASWQCDYEVGNLAWVPHLSSDQGEWLGVSAGRGLWGVKTCGRTGA
ncbi:WD repeat-containing protein [Colletotrichum paranaense]|uniref:WD repeat-containing protein n=1 Tax=Colletotrichum paranaense TaxID=1914294 RepID=A0ABQ9RVE8_9PEZI|nr:WD repeat-containing protein [Colletotrichum paranaense]KAK1515506.1 WD repeat-containing protein [Colletotrichum paranaense]